MSVFQDFALNVITKHCIVDNKYLNVDSMIKAISDVLEDWYTSNVTSVEIQEAKDCKTDEQLWEYICGYLEPECGMNILDIVGDCENENCYQKANDINDAVTSFIHDMLVNQ